MVMPVLIFEVAIAVTFMALPLRAEVRQVVDEEPMVESQRSGSSAGASLEDHGVDSATLVGGRGIRDASAGFRAPPVVVLPAPSHLAKRPVDVHLDTVVAGAVDEIHAELDRVRPSATQAARHGRKNEVVFRTTACGRI